MFAAGARADDWRPVTQAELAQKAPKVDPAADAEAIFWDVRIEDRYQGGDLSIDLHHYLRIKIFTDKGKEDFATVEIPRFGKRNISDVAARTIKQNGTIIDVKKDAVFDRELVKTKGLKVKGKSFALPNVEVGDIIEYKYRETRDNEIASYMRLYFQREIPLWTVTYHLKPLSVPWLPFGMRSMAFQVNHPPFQKDGQGFFSTSVNNVPAFKEEPDMPPQDQLRAWMLIYYEEDKKLDAEKFWKETGKSDFGRFKPLIKADDHVKRTAAELISGAAKPEDKLAALDTFCRTKIRNTSLERSHMTSEERKALKENKSPGDTLKQKAGTAADVDYLFAALANAAGFDARIARVPDRGDTFFVPARPTTYFIDDIIVAVNVEGKWTFYAPASPYLEAGMLPWQHELQQALISDPKEGFFVMTQYSPPERSKRHRQGVFTLAEDGTLEGTLTYTYTGHVARGQKNRYEEMTPAQQEEDWKKSLQGRLSTLEMSDFSIKDADDPAKPMVVKQKVTIPGYATRTGKRILLQPAFFERGLAPRFPESTRKWDIYFDYASLDEDDVTITLPEGWQLDQPTAPQSSTFKPVGSYMVDVKKTTDGRQLIYKRHFEWAAGGNVLIPVANYAQIKKIFDFMQEQDGYTITLKQAATNAN